VIFVWKFQNFRYHSNRFWSDTNFSHTVKSADPVNPLSGTRILMIYTIWVIADFLIKFTNFCYHSNKGGSSENLNDSVWSANHKTPVWCKILGPTLNVNWVIVICVWKFPHFRYHDNSGWSDTNFTYTVKSADRENPLFGTRILVISHTQAEL